MIRDVDSMEPLDIIRELLHPTYQNYEAELISIEDARWLLAHYDAAILNWNECLKRLEGRLSQVNSTDSWLE
jgi:hypothetical protein